MKKRLGFVFVYICLLSLFCCGMAELIFVDKGERVSETEKRLLQPFPALTAENIISGGFMEDFESYLSDGFFFREAAAAFHDKVMGVFALPDNGPATGEVAEDRLWDISSPAPEESSGHETAAPSPAEGGDDTPESQAQAAPASDAGAHDATLWLTKDNGEKYVLFTYSARSIQSFAQILNAYRAELPEDGRVIFANPQVSEVYWNINSRSRYTGWGSDLEDVMQPLVNDGVYIYDCTDILSPYIGEKNLYPQEDYHWHPISASLTVDKMLSDQGLPTVDYAQYRYYISTVESARAFTLETMANMRYTREAVEILEPISPAESYILNYISDRTRSTFINSRGGYDGYLRGHWGPWRLIDTGFHTGRNALFVGDCFIPPMIAFMAPYYDTIIATDVRELFYSEELSGGSISDYIKAYGVSDIYLIYSTNSRFWSDSLQSRLMAYLH